MMDTKFDMHDFIPNTNFKIFQNSKMFRLNSDSVNLGEFINFKSNQKILDIGTNNGVQLLYASLFNPFLLVGIDVNEKACEIAKINLLHNNINNFEIINTSLQNFNYSQFDVIICNPPFFQMKKDDNAKNEESLPLSDLIKHTKRLLKSNGQFFMIHKANRLVDIILELNKYGMFIKKMKLIFDSNKNQAINVLLEAKIGKNNKNLIIEKPIIKLH